ncbi:hypothetical protein MRX96_012252 [Rhipicephalus microplus]
MSPCSVSGTGERYVRTKWGFERRASQDGQAQTDRLPGIQPLSCRLFFKRGSVVHLGCLRETAEACLSDRQPDIGAHPVWSWDPVT